ncbi:hypothetical protein HPT25_12555 [Bacillus sp. BRMEA1]|uniref:YfhJ family protein n=1 Tax=Neobacillus endophyticus TaxID=2738405 RepID=UPI001565C409|nr:YfhJ family protein [Neobacillus endophyticus]NRD78218.1 hypothetical protein [Neobacillus endophyticus]
MNDYYERLTKQLLEKNHQISYNQARTLVELLWDDFETTYAKAGWEYQGSKMTEKIVKQWIDNYGETLHEFAEANPKYKQYLSQAKHTLH